MAAEPRPVPAPEQRIVRLLLLGMVLTQMTNHMVSVAVPAILADLGLNLERAGWIISAYLLPVAVLMPTWGAAGDLFGRRRIFRVGLLLFGLGALISLHKTTCTRNGLVRLLNPTPPVQQLLDLTRMHRIFEIVKR